MVWREDNGIEGPPVDTIVNERLALLPTPLDTQLESTQLQKPRLLLRRQVLILPERNNRQRWQRHEVESIPGLAAARRRDHGLVVKMARRRLSSALGQLLGAALGWTLLLAPGAALAGCGGGQTRGHPLDSSWSDEDGSELQAFQKEWKGVKPTRLANVAVGVVDNNMLVGRALGGSNDWFFRHAIEGRPVITGTVVVGIGGGELFALDAETGDKLWIREGIGRLRGAGDDGTTTLVSLESLTGTRSIVLAVDRSGQVVRQLYLEAVVGTPLVTDAVAFLPWNDNTVVIFDLIEGAEAARVVSSSPVSHAFSVGTELYFGEQQAVRFDEDIVEARRDGGSIVNLPSRHLPDLPRWHLPGSIPLPATATRHDSVRYYARPDGSAIDRYAGSYFRIVLGLAAPDGKTQWVHSGKHNYIAGWAGEETLALCDVAGTIRWLDMTTGAVVHTEQLFESVRGCAIQSESAPKHKAQNSPTMEDQLAEAIAIRDRQLEPVQQELLHELASRPTERATSALIRLASDPDRSGPPHRLRHEAAELLSRRRRGLNAMLHALSHQRGMRPSRLPLGSIARALQRSVVTEAAPLLAAELNDPTWPKADLVAVAKALEALARPAERQQLVVFLARLGCDPAMLDASMPIARTLGRLGAAAVVKRVAIDSCDDETMSAMLRAAAPEPVYPTPR